MIILQRGSKGKTVERLQLFLNSKGYSVGAADGDFGAKTELSLQRWQSANGLDADGLFGPASLELAKMQNFEDAAPLPDTVSPVKSSGKLILVSAGHSTEPPRDPGAVGNGFVEAHEALIVRDRVAKILRGKGFQVIEDGADGISEPLKKALVLARKATVAVEIHFNASDNPKATGTEVLAKTKHRKLAQALARVISAALGIPARGADGGYKPDNSGQHHRLAFCEAGGLIVEICFISNPHEMKSYAANFEKLCQSLADVLAAA